MFKLINNKDSKLFSNSMFIKNPDFFKDSVAFFDAYSNLCEKEIDEIPNYCVYPNGRYCLDGICLFLKTYASEFDFCTIDLSIEYLKTLYYAIASLSKDGKTVEKELIMSEYLVYKDANEKHYNRVKKEYLKTKKEHDENLLKFDNKNNKQTKYFMLSNVFKIFATVAIILSFAIAILPTTFYFIGKLELKKTLILVIAILAIGLFLKIEFKMLYNYYSNLAKDEAYLLQTLKRNKDASFYAFNDVKIKNSKIICDYYEYSNGLESAQLAKKLEFDKVLKLARKHNFKSFNLKNDILNLDMKQQEEIYDILERFLRVGANTVDKLETFYDEINTKDFLKFNKLIRYNFINKFIADATVSGKWKLNVNGSQVNPFGIDVKALAEEKIAFLPSEKELFLSTRLNVFFNTKYAKKLKNLQIKNIKDETTYNFVKMEYIEHFYDVDELNNMEQLLASDKNSKEIIISEELRQTKKQIPKLVKLKLGLLKSKIIRNSLGNKDFAKIKQVIENYENTLLDVDNISQNINIISEKTVENKNFIKTLFECDEIRDLGNNEVLCVVGDKSYKGFRLSNI